MELFALRALTRQPLRRLAPLGPNLARRFRDGDPVVVRQLAALDTRHGRLNDRKVDTEKVLQIHCALYVTATIRGGAATGAVRFSPICCRHMA